MHQDHVQLSTAGWQSKGGSKPALYPPHPWADCERNQPFVQIRVALDFL